MGYYKDRLVDEIRGQGFSENTVKSYVGSIREFIVYSKKVPEKLSHDDFLKYKNYLLKELKRSPATINCKIAAVRFFFTYVLKRDIRLEDYKLLKRHKSLPDVLSKEEVIEILNKIENIKHRTMFMGIYSSGLRKSEIINLKVSDVDTKRMSIHIRNAKGNKDRYVPLSPIFQKQLRKYWQEVPIDRSHLLFPSNHPKKKYNPKTLNEVLQKAVAKTKITKKVSVHTLRHSYATHSLEDGVSLRYIQMFLGHKRIDSTTVYTHLMDHRKANISSPLDAMSDQLVH